MAQKQTNTNNALKSIFEIISNAEYQIRQEIQDPIDHILNAIRKDSYCIYEFTESRLILDEITQYGGKLKDSKHKLEKMQKKFDKLENQKKE